MGLKGIPVASSPELPWARRVTVNVPKSAPLAALLAGSGGKFEKELNTLGAAADPASGTGTTVYFPAAMAQHVAGDLAALLARARSGGHPAAGLLAGVAAQFGIRDEAAPAPAAAARPAAPVPRAAPTLSASKPA